MTAATWTALWLARAEEHDARADACEAESRAHAAAARAHLLTSQLTGLPTYAGEERARAIEAAERAETYRGYAADYRRMARGARTAAAAEETEALP